MPPAPTPVPLNLDVLTRAVEGGATFAYRFFYGHRATADGSLSDSVFSQWWPCRFELLGRVYTSAEQYMMAEKARLFADTDTLMEILRTTDPAACKKLGRQVRGFDAERWEAARVKAVQRGNLAKFSQDPALRSHLLGTGDDLLVEAAPRDTIWGIGLGRDNALARDPRTWRGKNLLGFALVAVREVVRLGPGISWPRTHETAETTTALLDDLWYSLGEEGQIHVARGWSKETGEGRHVPERAARALATDSKRLTRVDVLIDRTGDYILVARVRRGVDDIRRDDEHRFRGFRLQYVLAED